MRRAVRSISGLLLLALVTPAAAVPAGLPEAWGQRPLAFEENRGQSDPQVLFLARASGYEFFLTAAAAVLVPQEGAGALHLRWLDANPTPRVHAEEQLSGRSQYFLGNEPAHWRTEIPLWSRIRLERLWPGIDLVFYGNPRELEHDFIVAPGADPGKIVLALDGARQAEIDAAGDLIVTLEEGGEVRLSKPVAYQETGKRRQEVPCQFRLLPGNQLTFAPGAWDRTRPLVIDPVVVWSTLLSGSDGYVIRLRRINGRTVGWPVPAQGMSVPG